MTRKRVGVSFGNAKKLEPYVRAVEAVGLEAVPISAQAPRSLDGLQGLLLSGGTDVDPARYAQPHSPECDAPDRPRDALETELALEALAKDLPLLAICRGMQLLNVVHGGSLIQHLESADVHRVRGPEPWRPAHEVLVVPGTRLAEILGAGACPVNSRHHQAIDRVGKDLRVSARYGEIVEALERADKRFALAVQWHPEDQVAADPRQRKLFEAFASAL